jgi:MFS transporter, MHS family, alpha-ketoglutarate permease
MRELSFKVRLLNIFRGCIGNLVEYFDWAIYAVFGIYFAAVFFPEGDQTAQLLKNAAVFAVGFVFRPLGGWWLGKIADHRGRKTALLISVSLMCAGSLLIALNPGYAVIGDWAPALLLLARIMQGFSIGGEYGSSATYLSEMATPKRRGFYSSFQYVTIVLGHLLALGMQILLQKWLLTSEELHEWGWRIPFLFGSVLAVVAIWLRNDMAETDSFVEHQSYSKSHANLQELLRHPRAVLTVVALTAGGTLSYYTYSVYLQKFLVNTSGFSKDDATLISALGLLVFMFIQPIFGLISDYIGRRLMLIGFGVCATLFTVPLLDRLAQPQSVISALSWYLCALLITSGYSSVNTILKAELFPVHIRALGVGFPYAVTVSLFGGTSEYLALWMKSVGHPEWYGYYVSTCTAGGLLVSLAMRESKSISEIDRD